MGPSMCRSDSFSCRLHRPLPARPVGSATIALSCAVPGALPRQVPHLRGRPCAQPEHRSDLRAHQRLTVCAQFRVGVDRVLSAGRRSEPSSLGGCGAALRAIGAAAGRVRPHGSRGSITRRRGRGRGGSAERRCVYAGAGVYGVEMVADERRAAFAKWARGGHRPWRRLSAAVLPPCPHRLTSPRPISSLIDFSRLTVRPAGTGPPSCAHLT